MNWTPTTPMLSDAVAETATEPETVLPAAGVVRDTVGCTVSPLPARVTRALSKFPEAQTPVTPLYTATPINALCGIARLTEPTAVHVTPSTDANDEKVLPVRRSLIQFGCF